MEDEPQRLEIRPNCSLTLRGAQVFFASACVVPFGMGGVLAWKGFWPILPFAGLEMALLAWALKMSLERRFHRQTITVTEHQVQVESLDARGSSQVVSRGIGRRLNFGAPRRACTRAGSPSSRMAGNTSWAASSRRRSGVDSHFGCSVSSPASSESFPERYAVRARQ